MSDYPFKEAFEAAYYATYFDSGVRRDRIATAALKGLLAADAGERNMGLQSYAMHEPQKTARTAVELADALIAELDKPAGAPVKP